MVVIRRTFIEMFESYVFCVVRILVPPTIEQWSVDSYEGPPFNLYFKLLFGIMISPTHCILHNTFIRLLKTHSYEVMSYAWVPGYFEAARWHCLCQNECAGAHDDFLFPVSVVEEWCGACHVARVCDVPLEMGRWWNKIKSRQGPNQLSQV